MLAGITISAPIVTFAPKIPSVLGGLIGGIVVYPIIVKIERHRYKNKRIPEKQTVEDSLSYNNKNSDINTGGSSSSSNSSFSPVSKPNTPESQPIPDNSGFKDVTLKSSKGTIESGGAS